MGRYLELLEKEAANRAGKRGTEGQTKGGPKGAPKYNNTPSVPLVPRSPVPVGRKKKTRPLVVRSTQIKLNYIIISMT